MTDKKPRILRKRYIPFETVDISKDEILLRNEELIITRWNVIRPRNDIARGISYTFLKEGYKISRFYDPNDRFIYWYCDIIEVEYQPEADEYTLVDLLVDVKLTVEGKLSVLDCDELAEAYEKKLISTAQLLNSLRRVDKILKMLDEGQFPPEVCRSEKYWV